MANVDQAKRESDTNVLAVFRRKHEGKDHLLRFTISDDPRFQVVNVRHWFKAYGKLLPTKLGCAIRMSEIDEVIEALRQAKNVLSARLATQSNQPPAPNNQPADPNRQSIPESAGRFAPPWECWPGK